MSFGWSAGDIVAALSLVNKIRIALKDSGGASSTYQEESAFLQTLSATLSHLNVAKTRCLAREQAENLRQLCEQIDKPLRSFLDQTQKVYESRLGSKSSDHNLLSVPYKVRWALSTSKDVKTLRDKIAGPLTSILVILNQQIMSVWPQLSRLD